MHLKNPLSIATAIIVACSPDSILHADVYRCVNDAGHTSYQQIRCNQYSQPLPVNHRPTGWTGLRSGERALLESYRAKDTNSRPLLQKNAAAEDDRYEKCAAARKQLLKIRVKLRRGYSLKESETLHQKRNDRKNYLRRFCSR
jgi:hypothetical protein